MPQENQGAHTWNVRPQAPTPAASLKIQRLIPEVSAEVVAGQTALLFVALTGLELTFDSLAVDRVGPLLAALSPVEDKVWSWSDSRCRLVWLEWRLARVLAPLTSACSPTGARLLLW